MRLFLTLTFVLCMMCLFTSYAQRDNKRTTLIRQSNNQHFLRVDQEFKKDGYQETLFTENGRSFSMKPNEVSTGMFNGKLFTTEINESSSTVRAYSVSNESIVEQNILQSNLGYLEIQVIPDNRLLLISDFNEGIGSGFRFFNEFLEPSSTYVPFKNGFSASHACSFKGNTAIATSSIDQKKIKLSIISNGYEHASTEIATSYRVKKLYGMDNIILAYMSKGGADRKIFAFDSKAQLIWQKSYKLPYFHLDVEIQEFKNSLLMITGSSELAFVNPKTGDLKNKVDFSRHLKNKKNDQLKLKVLDLRVNNDKILVALGKLVIDQTSQEFNKYLNPEVFLITEEGSLTKISENQGSYDIFRILPTIEGFKMVSEKETKVKLYENE